MSHAPTDPNPVQGTHQALFDTYFPLDELDIPPPLRPVIPVIATEVSEGMWEAFQQSPGMMAVLYGLTDPQALLAALPADERDYVNELATRVPAVKAFLSSGFAPLSKQGRVGFFAAFLEAPYNELRRIPAQLRIVYASGIWGLPLAMPLTGITAPQIFVEDIPSWVRAYYPNLPPSRLRYDAAKGVITHVDGEIDYVVVGSGPGGAAVAQQLRHAGLRVVLVERGPWVVWGSMNTRSYARLMMAGDQMESTDGGVILRSGQTLGGGSTVNIDLAFSPLEATVHRRITAWIEAGLLDPERFTVQALSDAYAWVRYAIETRQLSQDELNANNLVLWQAASDYGVDPFLYHLNRYPVGESPSPVDDKRDAARQLIQAAAQDPLNPLSVIPDADAADLFFEDDAKGTRIVAGVRITFREPWTECGNTVVDPCALKPEPGARAELRARNVVLAAGTLGTARILLRNALREPALASPRVGLGPIIHPSVPLVGIFDREINLLEGLDSATHVDAFGIDPGFIFETMTGLPAYGAVLVPGTGKQLYDVIRQFPYVAGFGVMLVDTPSDANRVKLNPNTGEAEIDYQLNEADKPRLRQGVAIAIRMMFSQGAKMVIVPSTENLLGSPDFDPTVGVYLTDPAQADLVERNMEFIPNRTVLTAAHLQASCKIGAGPATGVVSPEQRVWNHITQREIPNLYVMDSSVFPTSVGANPMQAIYTFARIFSDRRIAEEAAEGMASVKRVHVGAVPVVSSPDEAPAAAVE